MEIRTTQHNNSTVIQLAGRFDAGVAGDFKELIRNLITQDMTNFVIDLSAVSYMDSGGLGSLVASLRRVREHRGDIKMVSPSDKVRKVFELTRVYRIFDIYDDSEVAVLSYHSA